MKVEVRIQGTDLVNAVRNYTARRLHFALGRFVSRIGRIVVRISDINGVRGGIDQSCHISAELQPSGRVVLDQTDADLFTALPRLTAPAKELGGPSGGRSSGRVKRALAANR
jgi:ribosome hibernation promoting factor